MTEIKTRYTVRTSLVDGCIEIEEKTDAPFARHEIFKLATREKLAREALKRLGWWSPEDMAEITELIKERGELLERKLLAICLDRFEEIRFHNINDILEEKLDALQKTKN